MPLRPERVLGGRGWGGVTLALGTSVSPKFSLPITATSSVDGSVALPVCTGLPRGVGLAVIGPPFAGSRSAGGPVFLTCRPSMLRRWLDTTSAFLGVQSTIHAFCTQHAAFSRASSPESISRVHFCSYASRGPPLVGRWWSLRWLRSFRPTPVAGGLLPLFGGGASFDYIRWGPLQTPTDLSVVTYDVSCHEPPSWPESSSFVGVWSRGFDFCVSDFVPTTSVGRRYPFADRVTSPLFQSWPCWSPPPRRTASGRLWGWGRSRVGARSVV